MMSGGGGQGCVAAPGRCASEARWLSGAGWAAARRPWEAAQGHQGLASPRGT